MAVSGVLLNHSDDLHWNQQAISSHFWLQWYGVETTQAKNQMIGHQLLSVTDNGLYLAEQNLGDCSLLLGVIIQKEQVIVVCPQHILLLTPAGEVIDQIDSHHGLQSSFTATTSENNRVYLQASDAVYTLNTEDLTLNATTNHPVAWLEAIKPTTRISRERWLQDAHSGRLLGRWGVWLIDGLALILVVLMTSGLVLAKKRHHRML
jgi:hypothetical protein